jgi:hypothetical protein
MTFDVTTNRIPYGLLTPEEQGILKAWPHGWEFCSVEHPEDGWECTDGKPSWIGAFAYRGKPAPKVKSYWFNIYDGDNIGTIWTNQDAANYASLRENRNTVTMRMQICNGEVTVTKET